MRQPGDARNWNCHSPLLYLPDPSPPCFSVRSRCGGCLSDSLLGKICHLCHLSATPPARAIWAFPDSFLRIPSPRPEVPWTFCAEVFQFEDYLFRCPASQLKCPCSQWLKHVAWRTDPQVRLILDCPPLLTGEVKVLFAFLGFPESPLFKYWVPLKKEINVNYAQTSGIGKKT